MNATPLSPFTRLARASALLFTLGLFTVGSIPHAGEAFPGAMHWVTHVAVYALIAFAFGLGWPKRPLAHITILVSAIGIVHEITEISTHNHAFESEDAIVNAMGALIGVAIQRTMQRVITR